MITEDDDFAPVTGGVQLPDDFFRNDLDALHALKAESALDLHIIRLLFLHPRLQVRFRNQDLTKLSVKTKQSLLMDVNSLLGIQPFRNGKK